VSWLVLRSLVVLAGAFAGPEVASAWPGGLSRLGLVALFLVLAGLGCTAVVGLARWVRLGSKESRHWKRPSWRVRFLFGQPLQVFHAAGWCFIAAGLSAGLIGLTTPGYSLQGAVTMGGLGAGLLTGTHLFVRLFPRYFGPDDSQTARDVAER
jgi:hypothetical protein